MDGIVPLGIDDGEVTLPDVVWGWHDATSHAEDASTDPQETSVLELLGRTSLVLPVVSSRSSSPSSSQDPGDSPTRRKRSAVSSFFQGLKSSMGNSSGAPQTPVADTAPPILAALESVSTSSKRPGGSGSPSNKPTLAPLADHRDVSACRYGVEGSSASLGHSQPSASPSSSPSPFPPKHSPDGGSRHRIHSVSGSIAPLDIRRDPAASKSSDSPTKGHTRHRRSTKTTILRHSLLAEQEDALDLDPDPESAGEIVGMRLHSLLDASGMATEAASDPDPEFQHPVNAQSKTPRSLPPLTGKPPNATTSSSPRRLRQSLSDQDVTTTTASMRETDSVAIALPVCAVCGKRVYASNVSLALDFAHVVHRACFRCVACLEPLTLANFHRISIDTAVDGARFVCTTHYVERLEAKQHDPDLQCPTKKLDISSAFPGVKIS